VIETPLVITEQVGKWDIYCTIKGGGIAGQAEALRHGISRALNEADRERFRKTLKLAGLLTRDDRMVEVRKSVLRKSANASSIRNVNHTPRRKTGFF
jgi:small subunit ribosomal protein S9